MELDDEIFRRKTMGLARVGVFHPGTQHSWQTARALYKNEMLQWYITSIFYNSEVWPYKIERYLPKRLESLLNAEFKRFYHPDLPVDYVHTAGAYEWGFRFSARIGLRGLARHLNQLSNRFLSTEVARRLRSEDINVLWGYDGCSCEAFRQAKDLKIRNVLDKTVGDARAYNSIMTSVYDVYSEYFLSKNYRVSDREINIRDEEYDLADIIVTGSKFCAETIELARPDVCEKIRVLNYCFDDRFFPAPPLSPVSRRKPVRFLFVGQAGPRKGIHLLLQAIEKIAAADATLTIIGQLQVPNSVFARFADRVTLIPTVRREEVSRYMASSDCLVFPSYFEGSAISIYEALAMGLGVIQSKNTGMEIDDTVGTTLDTLAVESLTDAMVNVINDREKLSFWKANARSFAERFTFEKYAHNVRSVISSMVD